MKKLNKEFEVNSFYADDIENGTLERTIELLQEKLTLAKEKYPNCEYSLHSYMDYGSSMIKILARRLETDEEYNERIEKEKQNVLNNKKYWDNKAKELGVE